MLRTMKRFTRLSDITTECEIHNVSISPPDDSWIYEPDPLNDDLMIVKPNKQLEENTKKKSIFKVMSEVFGDYDPLEADK